MGAVVFQSTLPVRGATRTRRAAAPSIPTFQSTLPVRGATAAATFRPSTALPFQSTLPVRGATEIDDGDPIFRNISIHAPRAGSDTARRTRWASPSDFNPRSPCGERLRCGQIIINPPEISIHAPRAGSDRSRPSGRCAACYFNPRSPCGERPARRWRRQLPSLYFNPRSPCGERRRSSSGSWPRASISIHAPRAGSDSCAAQQFLAHCLISIHAPRAGSDAS